MRLVDGDLTAEARIRDAALALFPRDGFEGTTMRSIAEDAGVSPALVVHHYGSKEGLRQACDDHVIERIRTVKGDAIESDSLTDPSVMAGGFQIAAPLMEYLGWALTTGSDAAAALFDELVDESVRLTELAEAHGAMVAGPDVRTRAAVMLSMQMGSLVLQDHLRRYLDIDPMSPEGIMAISRATLEIVSGAMFAPGQAEAMREALDVAIANTRKENSDG
jgi:TetR/AcrR family transcriptional regulator, regulator of cefoperazone and chloramphenicol sensitivity